jgi:ribose-phosphate pyrophosphokinase
MIANLLHVAGVNHVITIDLHASQMQGFFKCPVDNLVAEPLLARWVRANVPNWLDAVVVSKNPGGTKRVTSFADALKLSFGIVTTDRRRNLMTFNESAIFEHLSMDGTYTTPGLVEAALDAEQNITPIDPISSNVPADAGKSRVRTRATSGPHARRVFNGSMEIPSSPLSKSTRIDSISNSPPLVTPQPEKINTSTSEPDDESAGDTGDEYTDEVCIESAKELTQTNESSVLATSFTAA